MIPTGPNPLPHGRGSLSSNPGPISALKVRSCRERHYGDQSLRKAAGVLVLTRPLLFFFLLGRRIFAQRRRFPRHMERGSRLRRHPRLHRYRDKSALLEIAAKARRNPSGQSVVVNPRRLRQRLNHPVDILGADVKMRRKSNPALPGRSDHALLLQLIHHLAAVDPRLLHRDDAGAVLRASIAE